MSHIQLIIISLASVAIISIWLAIAVLEKKENQSQTHDLKHTDEAGQEAPFSLKLTREAARVAAVRPAVTIPCKLLICGEW